METFLIFLAISLAASDKLDRTYLPPPGAHFAGGSPGDISLPLPHPSHSPGIGHTSHEGSQNFGLSGQPLNFGDKIPQVPFNYYPKKVPTTTTSYAFSQTTTYPSGKNLVTPASPINPIAGLPIIAQGQSSYPYGFNEGQSIQYLPTYTPTQSQGESNFGTEAQPGLGLQGPTLTPTTYDNQKYGQPGSLNQYLGQSVVVPGSNTQTAGENQVSQYPGGQAIDQQGFLPSTVPFQGAPINLQPSSNQYGVNYDNSRVLIPQGAYSSQPNQILGKSQQKQITYQNQVPVNISETLQYPAGNQNIIPSGQPGFENLYQPGSTSSTIPSYYNGVSSTTPLPGVPSSTSAYSSVSPVYRPERPLATADRNAVILNYENVRTPNGYSYSFDTSNGIHADESGLVDNGTKTQGAYSYTGDDGKVYSVVYTADENGFQPHGDHLPTPPPIPEAIKKVIEQAARDEAAGIFDDGSYDEAKYGDNQYHGAANRRRPQHRGENKKPFRVQDDQVIPIAGINGAQYKDITSARQINNNQPSVKRPSSSSTSQLNSKYDYTTEDNLDSTKRGPSGKHPTSNNVKTMKIKYPGSVVNVGDDFLSTEKNIFDNRDKETEDRNPIFSDISNKTELFEYDLVTDAPISTGTMKQISKQRTKGNRRPGTTKNIINNLDNSTPAKVQGNIHSISDYIKNAGNQVVGIPKTQSNNGGYYYQAPGTNKFPTRFSPQEISTMKQDQPREFGEVIRKPFITPNVYNQNERTRQSTTRRPFTTVGVTSPTENSYTEYDDGDDYETDPDIDDDRVSSSRIPGSSQQTKTTSKYEYTSGNGQVMQGSPAPRHKTKHTGTETLGYKYSSATTTPIPTHTIRFGSTETPSYTPTTVVSQTPQRLNGPIGSVFGYTSPNYYSPNDVQGFDLSSNPQDHPISTNGPALNYPGTTVLPISGYQKGVNSFASSGFPGNSPTEIFQTGYHYGPPKIEFMTPSGTVSSSSLSGTYPNSYPDTSYPSVTSIPSNPGTFFLSQNNGNNAPSYQGNQNGLSSPNYSNTIVSSTPGLRPTLEGAGYEKDSTYSITNSPSTIATTPGSIPSVTPTIPSQIFSTNYPSIQTTKDTYIGGPVDGFGRPIIDQSGQTGYTLPNQGSTGPIYQEPGFNGIQDGKPKTDPTTGNGLLGNRPVINKAPEFGTGQTNNQPSIIGEDFTGPKQPQRFDPKTGYHY